MTLQSLIERLEGMSHTPQPHWDAAVLLPITMAETPQLIFLKRSQHLSSHPGEIAFPGGKRDTTDEGPVHTALRETEEEIGLSPTHIRVFSTLPQQRSKSDLAVTPVVGLVPANSPVGPNSDESESVFCVPLDNFLKTRPDRSYRISRGEETYFIPAWDWQGHEIWGLTAMILLSFLERAKLRHQDLRTPPSDIPIVNPYEGSRQS